MRKSVENSKTDKPIEPFLKWAGGKRWFADHHMGFFPKSFNRYIEPFVGSGAIFFALKPSKAILSDSNKELIETYQAIKNNWKLVLKNLTFHSNSHNKNHYYKVRSAVPRSKYARAARFIYLNRTCWNGLYRVNGEGEFNVPIGTRNEVLRKNDSFGKIAKALEAVELKAVDFEKTIDRAENNDLIFVDPPYTVKHNNNGFIKYNEKMFSWEDQIRLRNSLQKARERGAYVFVTNAFHKPICELYKEFFKTIRLKRISTIAADAKKRGLTEELLIVG